MVKSGGKTWYFLTADYAFGHALERDVSAVVKDNGGSVLGHSLVPINTSDFSAFLVQAQASKAQVIGLANAGGDTINSIKQAAEFGIVKGGQKLAGLLVFITDVHSIGLPLAQGLQLTEAFYWDLNDGTRAFAKRFGAKMNGRMPTSIQAGFYSAVKHYLEAIKAAGTDQPDAVMAKMKATPTDDPLFGKGYIRADNRKMHTMYLFEVKSPANERAVQLLQADPHDSRRGSVPPAGKKRLPAGKEGLTRRGDRGQRARVTPLPAPLSQEPVMQLETRKVYDALVVDMRGRLDSHTVGDAGDRLVASCRARTERSCSTSRRSTT